MTLSYLYLFGALVAYEYGIAKLDSAMGLSSLSKTSRALIAGAFTILPPCFFFLEYWLIDEAMRTAGDSEKRQERLAATKVYQEYASKIWIAVYAGIVFLYLRDMR